MSQTITTTDADPTPLVTERLKCPAESWAELVRLEPELGRVDRLIDLLDNTRDWPRTYLAVRDYAGVLVGWNRGVQAPDFDTYHEAGGGLRWRTIADLPEPIVSPPLTDAERWLRTSAAYDLATDYLIDRLEAAA